MMVECYAVLYYTVRHISSHGYLPIFVLSTDRVYWAHLASFTCLFCLRLCAWRLAACMLWTHLEHMCPFTALVCSPRTVLQSSPMYPH